jgi:hypothetical protein
MSNLVNDRLLERASEAVDYWTGTMWARLIEQDLKNNDLEALAYHVREAEKEEAIQESNPV